MKNFIKIMAASTAAIALISACQSETGKTKTEQAVKSAGKHVKKGHWEYKGEYGPENWGDISVEFEACKSGRLQSPFDITADITADLPALGLRYKAVPMKVINNGHTIQLDQNGAGQMLVGGKTYNLLQFHFHAGSEYAINGKKYPLEVHLVHIDKDGQLAVLGVMFEEGEQNAELAKIWANMPAKKGENLVDGAMVDVNGLLPANKQYYRFMGSLTTPPCSEGVHWHMLTTPITASKAQIEAFKAIFPMNARPLQPENNRLVVLGK